MFVSKVKSLVVGFVRLKHYVNFRIRMILNYCYYILLFVHLMQTWDSDVVLDEALVPQGRQSTSLGVVFIWRQREKQRKNNKDTREITTNGGNHNGNVNDVWTRETVGRKRSIKGGMKQLDETFILFWRDISPHHH